MKVQIFFKSSNSTTLEMKSCKTEFRGEALIGMTWESVDHKILFIALAWRVTRRAAEVQEMETTKVEIVGCGKLERCGQCECSPPGFLSRLWNKINKGDRWTCTCGMLWERKVPTYYSSMYWVATDGRKL